MFSYTHSDKYIGNDIWILINRVYITGILISYMGIVGIGDAFGSRYPTMQVFDRRGNWHVIPLRGITGTLVLASIEGKLYPFILESNAFKTYTYKGAKTVKTILFSLEDALPIDTNALQKIKSNAEKTGIESLDIDVAGVIIRAAELIAESDKGYITLEEMKADAVERGEDISVMLDDFRTKTGLIKVVEPLPEVTRYIKERLTVSPSLLTSAFLEMKQMNWEWRKVANPAKTPFGHWTLIILMILGLGGGGAVLVLGIEEGWFDNLGGGGPGLSFEDLLNLQEQFPGGPPITDPGVPAESQGIDLPDINDLRDTLNLPAPEPVPENDTVISPPEPVPENDTAAAVIQEPVVQEQSPPTIVGGPTEYREAAYVEPLAVQCGFGTVLHDGVCEVDWGRGGPPIYVPEPDLPEWHPGALSDSDRTLNEYIDYLNGVG